MARTYLLAATLNVWVLVLILAAGFAVQLIAGEPPCPLCVLQRVAPMLCAFGPLYVLLQSRGGALTSRDLCLSRYCRGQFAIGDCRGRAPLGSSIGSDRISPLQIAMVARGTEMTCRIRLCYREAAKRLSNPPEGSVGAAPLSRFVLLGEPIGGSVLSFCLGDAGLSLVATEFVVFVSVA
jgi:Disulfide bond formation protein DsbB